MEDSQVRNLAESAGFEAAEDHHVNMNVQSLRSPKPVIYVKGMGGLGDNIHQRAMIRQWMTKFDVWLETPYPNVYLDFISLGLKCKHHKTTLRSPSENVVLNEHLYSPLLPPVTLTTRQVWWRAYSVKLLGSVLASMIKESSAPG